MSLLLEALKRAEKAKEEAQRRAREGGGETTAELRLADEAPAADAKRVVTRDELPPITSPLEIQSEDLRAEPAAASGLSLQEPAAPPPRRGAPEPQAAQRAAARKVFEAKVREPNPRLPFYITMGALGAFAVGTVIYFWIQMRPPAPLFNPNPPPSGEIPVAAAPAPAPTAGPGATASGPLASIPGLPPASQTPAPAPAGTPAPAPQRAAPPVPPERPAARAAPKPRPAPRAAAPRPAPFAPAPAGRPQPRIHPLVASGYAAYQEGDMERARSAYERALAEEPGNRDALLGLAAVETRARRYEAAGALYRQLLLADPRDPHAHAGLVALRAPRADPLAAESRLKGLLAAGSEEGVLYFALGNQYAQQGRWPEAQRAYARAAALEPENPDYLYNLAVSHEHLRQSESALPVYRKALVLGLRRTASFDPAAAQARVEALSR